MKVKVKEARPSNLLVRLTRLSRRSFGLRVGVINREGTKVRRSLQKQKELGDAKSRVQAARRSNQDLRARKAREVMEEHVKKGEEARRGKEERREEVMQRQIASRQKVRGEKRRKRGWSDDPSSSDIRPTNTISQMVARKLLYRSGVNTLEDMEEVASMQWKLGEGGKV